jgi:hypothetical protein
MQSAQDWATKNVPDAVDGARDRCIFLQGKMRAGPIVIFHVTEQQVTEVALTWSRHSPRARADPGRAGRCAENRCTCSGAADRGETQYTTGGIVAPGGVILELLPINDELVIEARLSPNDITHVKEEQSALVRLTALNQRLTPMVDGKVVYVSADTVADQGARRTGEQDAVRRDSFILRVRLDERDTRDKVENFSPPPGMPADVSIEQNAAMHVLFAATGRPC